MELNSSQLPLSSGEELPVVFYLEQIQSELCFVRGFCQ